MNDDTQDNNPMTAFDDRLARMTARLAQDVQPARDLWPAVAEAIADERDQGRSRPRFAGWFAQAAAVVLLVGGSSGITWYAMQDDAALSPVAEPGQLVFEPVSGSFGADYTLGPDYTDARNALVAKLDTQLARLSPATRVEVKKNLATIRAAIVDINRALAKEPDNALLQELLLNTYSDELTVMKKVDGLTHSVMRRDDI